MPKMKRIRILSLFSTLLFGLMFSSSILAQTAKDSEGVVSRESTDVKAQHYKDVADSYLKYLNEKNLEGILSLYADSATVEDPVGSKIWSGKEALRKFYSGAVNIDLSLTRTGPVRVAGVEIAFPFQLRMNVEGTPMISDIIDVFRFDEAGKIVSMRAFWGPTNRRIATE